MISPKTLNKWRKNALEIREKEQNPPYLSEDFRYPLIVKELTKQVLQLTQELLDLHLIKK